jgi:hypothetical protein
MERRSPAGLSTKLVLEILILTARRSTKTGEAVRPGIDMQRAVWEIPAQRMKAKRAQPAPERRCRQRPGFNLVNISPGTGLPCWQHCRA